MFLPTLKMLKCCKVINRGLKNNGIYSISRLSVIGGLEWTTGMDFDLFFLFFSQELTICIEELV